jgi:hypothetical protein
MLAPDRADHGTSSSQPERAGEPDYVRNANAAETMPAIEKTIPRYQ